jgi:thioredoxin-related protein
LGATSGLCAAIPAATLLRRPLQGISAAIPGANRITSCAFSHQGFIIGSISYIVLPLNREKAIFTEMKYRMIKKLFLAFGLAAVVVLGQSFFDKSTELTGGDGPVKWYTFGEAVEMQKKSPRPIMVDVYTQWCGPCRLMSANTFGNETIAKYLNEHFYPVKFDAETFDSVSFNGYTFRNKNAPGTNRPVHDFAASILDGKLVYPSIVFLNEEIKRVQIVTGYYKADAFEPLMKFFGSGQYKTVSYEEFQKTFVPEIK